MHQPRAEGAHPAQGIRFDIGAGHAGDKKRKGRVKRQVWQDKGDQAATRKGSSREDKECPEGQLSH